MTMTEAVPSSAEQNARGWIETITAAHEAWGFCSTGFHHLSQEARNLSREARACMKDHGFDGTNHDDVAEAIEEFMREAALSVEVRSGWQSPDEHLDPEEFQILLTTGGPALRLVGELEDLQPGRSSFEVQDWGTPWTATHCQHEREVEAKNWFAGLFWFG